MLENETYSNVGGYVVETAGGRMTTHLLTVNR